MAHKTAKIGLWWLLLSLILPFSVMAEMVLKWDSVAGEVTGYKIYYGESPGNYTENRDVGKVTEYDISNLDITEGISYYFVVRSYNATSESTNSNEVSWTLPDTTPPMPPTGVTCQSGTFNIQWQANSEKDLDGYRIYYGTESRSYGSPITVGGVTTYTMQALQEGTTYYIAITAVDQFGNESGYSSEDTMLIMDAPGEPPPIGSENLIPKQNWSLKYVDSEELAGENGAATNGFDGDPETIWHTEWSNTTVQLPHEIQIDTGATYVIEGFRYLPRQIGSNGTVALFEFYISTDGLEWGDPVASGEFTHDITEKEVLFSNRTGRFIRFRSLREVNGGPWTSMAEISLLGSLSTTDSPDETKPTVSIDLPTMEGSFQTTSATISISGNASDNIGVSQVRWANNQGGGGTASGTTNWSVSGIALSAGQNVLTVTASDDAGNEADTTLTVTYTPPDTTSPTLTISSPTTASNYSTSQSTVSLAGTSSDNVGVTGVSWSSSRGGSGSAVGTTSWSISKIPLFEGQNTITVKASDAAGNESGRILTVTYSPPDTSIPVIGFTTPTSGGTYYTTNSVISMSGTATDNIGVAQVTWSNSRGGSGTATGTNNWTISNILLAEGQNLITITAVDTAGNESEKILTATYTIPDTTVPSVNITSPTQNSTYVTSSSTINLGGNAADNDSVSQVRWVNSRGDGDVANGTTSWTASGISLAEGTNEITVIAKDPSGNESSEMIIVTYTPADTIMPLVVITEPTSSGSYATGNGSVNLSGSASDNLGISQVVWSNSRGGSGIAIGTTSWSASGISLSEGENSITITAKDSAGNQGAAILQINYTKADTTLPQLAITSPTSAGSYTASAASIDLAGSASDNVGVSRVTWSNSRGGSGTASGTASWGVTGIKLLDGQNIITVTAEDAAGNQASDILTVTYEAVDTKAPVILRSKPTSAGYFFTRRTTVTIAGTASDDTGVSEVTWTSENENGVAKGTTEWSITGVRLTRGWNTITITAKDAVGNESTDTFTVVCWYF